MLKSFGVFVVVLVAVLLSSLSYFGFGFWFCLLIGPCVVGVLVFRPIWDPPKPEKPLSREEAEKPSF